MRSGKVYLIGAGPGDPELMTLKAARALGRADVVLVDDLVNRGCLAHVRSGARIVEVGKRGGCKSISQLFIQKMMVETAKCGQTVARLKGGDPFVFGRGGEEMQAALEAGLEVEVIAGVTAGIGIPACLGIPVTHRELARGVTLVTGHTKDGSEPNWQALACSGTTLVIYMGLKNLERIAASLKAAGMDPATPACIIENGSLRTQRHLVTALGALSGAGFQGPCIVVVGEVVRFARTGALPHARAA